MHIYQQIWTASDSEPELDTKPQTDPGSEADTGLLPALDCASIESAGIYLHMHV